MNYDLFLRLLKDYVEDKKRQAKVLYQDEKTISFVEEILDQKYEHTRRVVDYVVDLSKKLNMNINFEHIAMASGLFHDIGRFKQGLIHRSYNDSIVFPDNKNHGDYGFELITTSPEEMSIFDKVVMKNEKPVVAKTVEFHQKTELPDEFNHHINREAQLSNPKELLTGSYNFNEYEKVIVSALLHMVRDADRMDILWQRASGEIVPLRDLFYLKNEGSISDIAKRWGVSEQLLKQYNDDERLANNSHVIIPREAIPVEKLFISDELKEKMKNFESLDLRTLQKEVDYTTITALWWTIYTFLKDMNFVGNLKQVKEREFLEQIYNRYPKEYRPVIDEIFKFANETLIEEQLYNSNDDIYVNHSR